MGQLVPSQYLQGEFFGNNVSNDRDRAALFPYPMTPKPTIREEKGGDHDPQI